MGPYGSRAIRLLKVLIDEFRPFRLAGPADPAQRGRSKWFNSRIHIRELSGSVVAVRCTETLLSRRGCSVRCLRRTSVPCEARSREAR